MTHEKVMNNKYSVGDIIAILNKEYPERIVDILYIRSATEVSKDETVYDIYSVFDGNLFGIETEATIDSFFTAGTFTIAYKHYKVLE